MSTASNKLYGGTSCPPLQATFAMGGGGNTSTMAIDADGNDSFPYK
jgi:hypothetical protein